MNSLQGSKFRFILAALMIVGLAFVGCESEKMDSVAGPDNTFGSPGLEQPLAKRINRDNSMTYPQTASHVFRYSPYQNKYESGTITVSPSRSVFALVWGALTPPKDMWGDDVTITFKIDKDSVNNELIFTFDPHGCKFYPSARVILDYSELGIDIPTLYYIDENGKYIKQQPDDIDVKGRKLTLYIDHFSRYALVHG